MTDDNAGPQLQRILAQARQERLSRSAASGSRPAPRGYDADHPRIDLLRYRSALRRDAFGFEPVLHSPELLDRVRADWRALRPLLEWVATNAE